MDVLSARIDNGHTPHFARYAHRLGSFLCGGYSAIGLDASVPQVAPLPAALVAHVGIVFGLIIEDTYIAVRTARRA